MKLEALLDRHPDLTTEEKVFLLYFSKDRTTKITVDLLEAIYEVAINLYSKKGVGLPPLPSERLIQVWQPFIDSHVKPVVFCDYLGIPVPSDLRTPTIQEPFYIIPQSDYGDRLEAGSDSDEYETIIEDIQTWQTKKVKERNKQLYNYQRMSPAPIKIVDPQIEKELIKSSKGKLLGIYQRGNGASVVIGFGVVNIILAASVYIKLALSLRIPCNTQIVRNGKAIRSYCISGSEEVNVIKFDIKTNNFEVKEERERLASLNEQLAKISITAQNDREVVQGSRVTRSCN